LQTPTLPLSTASVISTVVSTPLNIGRYPGRFYNVSVYLYIQKLDGLFGPPWKFPAEAVFGARKAVGGEVPRSNPFRVTPFN